MKAGFHALMVWQRIKAFFNKQTPKNQNNDMPDLEFKWVSADENPFQVPVLDIRPVTLGMMSTTSSQEQAANALSYSKDDGRGFLQEVPNQPLVDMDLRFPIDGTLANGSLFLPQQMEHKWAIYYHDHKILFIRSWLRVVQAVAETKIEGNELVITGLRGWFLAENEDAAYAQRVLDFLMRSHAFGQIFPAPLEPGMEQHPLTAAHFCMNLFGSLAPYATHHPITYSELPILRSNSLLHIATAWGDHQAIKRNLDAGMPIDLLASDGTAPLHWAVVAKGTETLAFLLACGSPVDVRSEAGATPLMNAVQDDKQAAASFLIERGADVNATDKRGFTALHRAAEMGKPALVRLLLESGASATVEAEGHTPRSLAELRNEQQILKLLDQQGS